MKLTFRDRWLTLAPSQIFQTRMQTLMLRTGQLRKKQRKSTNGSESLNSESCSTKPNDSVILISDDDNSSEDETSFNISHVEVQDY